MIGDSYRPTLFCFYLFALVAGALTLFSCTPSESQSSNGRTGGTDTAQDGDDGSFAISTSRSSLDSGGSIIVSWNEVDGSEGYYLKLSSQKNCSDEILGLDVSGVSQRISISQEGTFYICVTALLENGQTVVATNNSLAITVGSSSSNSSEVGDEEEEVADPNTAPTFSFVQPMGGDDSVAIGSAFNITWTDSDTDDDATITLYYKTTNTGACNIGTQIGATHSEDDATDSASFDTTGLGDDFYYICARIDDGTNTAVETHSAALAVYPTGTCAWLGFTDTNWGTASNWAGCTGTPDDISEWVIILEDAPNQPTYSVADSIAGFSAGNGGGTLTIDGVDFDVNEENDCVQSSVNVESANGGRLVFDRHMDIINNASLGLGLDLDVSLAWNGNILVGDGSTGGELKTTSFVSDDSRWPYFTTIYDVIIGGAAAQPAKINVNGIKFSRLQGGSSKTGRLNFNNYWEIVNFDNVQLASQVVDNQEVFIEINNCDTNSVTDTTWDGIYFLDNPEDNNIVSDCCLRLYNSRADRHQWWRSRLWIGLC